MEDLSQTQFEDAMNVLVTRHSALRTIIRDDGEQMIEPIDHCPFKLLVHDNDVKGDASALFSGTMSSAGVASRTTSSSLRQLPSSLLLAMVTE